MVIKLRRPYAALSLVTMTNRALPGERQWPHIPYVLDPTLEEIVRGKERGRAEMRGTRHTYIHTTKRKLRHPYIGKMKSANKLISVYAGHKDILLII